MTKKIDVLGTVYTVEITNREQNPNLEAQDGYCDSSVKKIVVDDFSADTDDKLKKENLAVQTKETLRHEIVHAFLTESGLSVCSDWATNEELVDWIAMQGLKFYKAWEEAGAVDE